jgi:serine/threonine protein kinase
MDNIIYVFFSSSSSLAVEFVLINRYQPIPTTYSTDLSEIVDLCLNRDLRARPSVDQILKRQSKSEFTIKFEIQSLLFFFLGLISKSKALGLETFIEPIELKREISGPISKDAGESQPDAKSKGKKSLLFQYLYLFFLNFT